MVTHTASEIHVSGIHAPKQIQDFRNRVWWRRSRTKDLDLGLTDSTHSSNPELIFAAACPTIHSRPYLRDSID